MVTTKRISHFLSFLLYVKHFSWHTLCGQPSFSTI